MHNGFCDFRNRFVNCADNALIIADMAQLRKEKICCCNEIHTCKGRGDVLLFVDNYS